MKKIVLVISIFMIVASTAYSQAYAVGDKVDHFKLKNVDDQFVSTKDYKNAKGFIIVFTCNTCPYAVKYEDRINALDKKYKVKHFPVIAINPNDPEVQSDDTYALMKDKAKEKNFSFPYLYDPGRKVSAVFGATRTPHIYLLSKKDKKLTVEYIGAIDDNFKDASKVNKKYLEDAIDALLAGKKPVPNHTKAIGCSVKKKS